MRVIVKEYDFKVGVKSFHKEFDKNVKVAIDKYGDFANMLNINTDNNYSRFELSIPHCNEDNRKHIEDYLTLAIEKIVNDQMK